MNNLPFEEKHFLRVINNAQFKIFFCRNKQPLPFIISLPVSGVWRENLSLMDTLAQNRQQNLLRCSVRYTVTLREDIESGLRKKNFGSVIVVLLTDSGAHQVVQQESWGSIAASTKCSRSC